MHPEFPLQKNLYYLNHAAVSPWPTRTATAVQAFARENQCQGSMRYLQWLKIETSLRQQLQWLVGAQSPDDIALLKNTSEGLSIIAYGLDWKEGDNVVSTDQEFPSNRIVWESLASQGVTLRQADVNQVDPEQAMIDLMDHNTRLLSVSSVQYGTGLRMDLVRLGQACRARGILFCVDAIQSLGAHSFDVQTIQADFVVADGHKWMLGPEGLAVFYAHESARDQLTLHQYGWHMVEQVGDFDRQTWEVAASARRFEAGSPNMLAIHALQASLSLLQEVGMEAVEDAMMQRSRWFIERIQSEPSLYLITPESDARHAGIITFHCKGVDQLALYHTLMDQGVMCAYRAGGIRFSPHFYTPWHVLEKGIACVLEVCDAAI